MKTKKPAPPAPNIAFIGARDKKDPLRVISNGDSPAIRLPKNQSKPFYHPQAKTICRLFGWLYKPVVGK
ncbi:MAG: hypothetical protein JSS81_26785 [Acidobacteria bacterium]|nr:hypothetical protein [Acidobacteriota bacterium]